ncbi:GNAT family N-acetyltransferase [Micromonospora sp. HUAS LYJ1]|uniref:GNAT family N-acetyltransferase n=1 Tax=Micromonospora sp. HUAS LYJ1 TaxID=3061626 RepID=UPI0026732870|nr:GNAT family N-acetyltransferase [Micromonospora sp. HUAS LYJ1]WKU04453.1 GNAT family N-acetyltransferase [Micromonospora sp. HUAS LYJ1]
MSATRSPRDQSARTLDPAAFVVEPGDPDDADVAALLLQSEEYSHSLYPAESVHTLPVGELRRSGVRFLVARDAAGGELLGCGAVVRVDDTYAELKRMFVHPGARRRGVATVLLTALESWARRAGTPVVRLETGVSQPEAVSLYRRFGYVRRERFGGYPDDPLSIFMEKSLDGRSATWEQESAMDTMPQRVLVLVDGYSSGAQLPGVLRERGWRCVHVQSTPDLAPYFLRTFDAADYLDRFTYTGDVDALVAGLARHRPSAVLPGAESGVVVADLLAAALGLPGNSTDTSRARRDKYEMHNRVRAAGLRSMDHFLARDLDSLVEWASAGAWPVVLKPTDSSGTDSVTFCADQAELAETFRRMHGTVHQMGVRNDAVLAQRFLTGREYFINGVSGDGRHVVTEIWRTDKIQVPGAGWIYDRSVLFDPTQPQLKEIVDYVHGVLDALGVRYGAHHTELMVGPDGPTLVECASRLSGGLHRAAAAHAVGASMLDLVADIVVEGPAFVSRYADERTGHAHPLWQVQFISEQEGVVVESHYAQLLETLRSRTWLQRAPKVGDRVTRTTDLFSSPGIVFMTHPDVDVLAADYALVRQWERERRLFTVAQ